MSDAANLKEYLVEVRRGNIPGHSIVHKFGDNPMVINGVWSLVSPVSQNEAMPASGSPVRIKAGGNVADDINGTGCRTIEIIGINTDFEEVSEIIETNGNSVSISSIHSYWRLHRIKSIDVGAYGNNNVGILTLENINGSSDRLLLRAGEGQSQHGMWSSPHGKTSYVLGIDIESDSSKAADFRVCVRENYNIVVAPMKAMRVRIFFSGVIGQGTSKTKTPIISLPPMSDIWITAKGGGANTAVSVDIEILVIDNEVSHIKVI